MRRMSHTETLARADALAARGAHAEALALLDPAVAADPRWFAGRFARARSLAATGDRYRAVEELRIALSNDPRLVEVARTADWVTPLRDDPYVVIGLAEDPRLTDALDPLYGGDTEEAEEAWAPLLAGAPDSATHHFVWGVICANQGRHEEALAAADRTIALLPTFQDAWFNRGAALEALGRPEEAIEAYRTAVRHTPPYANGWFNLAHALDGLGRTDEALAAWDEAVRHAPVDPMFHYRRAVALARAGRVAEATAALRRTLELDPDAGVAIAEDEVLRAALDPAIFDELSGRA